jgi:hypothetical protein
MLDEEEGKRRRDEGMARVIKNDPAYHALLRFYVRLPLDTEFTADEIHAQYRAEGGIEPHHPNVYGSAVRSALHRGYLQTNYDVQGAKLVTSHASKIFVLRPRDSEARRVLRILMGEDDADL